MCVSVFWCVVWLSDNLTVTLSISLCFSSSAKRNCRSRWKDDDSNAWWWGRRRASRVHEGGVSILAAIILFQHVSLSLSPQTQTHAHTLFETDLAPLKRQLCVSYLIRCVRVIRMCATVEICCAFVIVSWVEGNGWVDGWARGWVGRWCPLQCLLPAFASVLQSPPGSQMKQNRVFMSQQNNQSINQWMNQSMNLAPHPSCARASAPSLACANVRFPPLNSGIDLHLARDLKQKRNYSIHMRACRCRYANANTRICR